MCLGCDSFVQSNERAMQWNLVLCSEVANKNMLLKENSHQGSHFKLGVVYEHLCKIIIIIKFVVDECPIIYFKFS